MKLVKKVNKVYWKYLTFNASNNLQEFTVPSNVTKLQVDCVASKGMDGNYANGGNGGRVQCVLSVTPLQTLYVMVGIIPTAMHNSTYNASDIRTDNTGITNATSLNSRLVVAGGGGSSRNGGYAAGGAGGGLTGANGSGRNSGGGGKGGTQTAGGGGGGGGYAAEGGAKGSFGLGGQVRGGDGGAGWYGGGSGGNGSWSDQGGGGGGGSSYTQPDLCTGVTHTQGYQNGAGYIRIDYISDESDYDYTKDEIICYAVKEEGTAGNTYKGVN